MDTIHLTPANPCFPTQINRYLPNKKSDQLTAIGNLDLLQSFKIGLICSRACPGRIILKTYDYFTHLNNHYRIYAGGFHSSMEKECLRLLLRAKHPVIISPARSIEAMRIPKEWKLPIEENRMLVLSPFEPKQNRITKKLSFERNLFVAALADELLVPYANPEGSTTKIVSQAEEWGKKIYTFQ